MCLLILIPSTGPLLNSDIHTTQRKTHRETEQLKDSGNQKNCLLRWWSSSCWQENRVPTSQITPVCKPLLFLGKPLGRWKTEPSPSLPTLHIPSLSCVNITQGLCKPLYFSSSTWDQSSLLFRTFLLSSFLCAWSSSGSSLSEFQFLFLQESMDNYAVVT